MVREFCPKEANRLLSKIDMTLKTIYPKLISFLLFLIFAVGALAYNISGIMTDSSGEPLVGASVRLLTPHDSTMVRSAVADANGRFSLRDVAKGNYIVELSYVGSKTEFRRVTMKDANLSLGTVKLADDALMLKETVVTGIRTPIKVMQDTVEYSAETYKVQPNAVVEDLLKRLPGVEVGTDGSITSNGKTISKILVDGKEFFSDDPTVASKNLPVNMVEKVQVVDRKSDLARLTGVDDGEEETVINLTVKKGMKNGWFGTLDAGYGTDSRYKGSFVVNRFWNDNQITFLGGLNNINEPGFTDGSSGRFRRFGGDNGLTRSKALGINFNVGNKEIFRIGGNVMYSHTDRRTISRQERQYLFVDSTSYVTSNRYAKDQGHNFRADFRLQWNPDSNNTFEFRPNLSFNSNDSYSNDSSLTRSGSFVDVTRSRNISSSHGTSWEFGAQLIYNHKFKHRGRSLSVFAQLRTSNVRENEDAYSWNKFYLLNDSVDLYDQYNTNHTWSNNLSARVTWTEPLGNPAKGHFLTLAYRFQYRWNNADKLTYDRNVDWPYGWDFDPVIGEELIYNPELSNRFRNDYMNQDIRAGYKFVNSSNNLEVGVSAVPQKSTSIDLIDENRNIERSTWNVAPFMRYRLKLSKTRSLNIDYRGRSSQPSINQLQPVADMSDPLRIVIGNPGLNPSFTHNIRFRFQDFNQKEQRSVMAMLNASVVQNSIVSSTTYNSETGGQVTTYQNVNGAWNAFGGVMFSMPFRNRSWTTSMFSMLNYNHSVGFNNGSRNLSSSFNINLAPGIAFRPDHVQLELRPRYGLQTVANSLASTNNRTVHSYGGRFDGTFYTNFGLTLSSDLEYTATSGYAAGYDTRAWMWNAQISYSFLRGQNATVSLRAYDILNQKSNIRRNITANYIDDTEYNSLTRYVMVSFTYRFNTFGKGNEPESRNQRFGPGGMRGPGGPPPGGPGGPPRP